MTEATNGVERRLVYRLVMMWRQACAEGVLPTLRDMERQDMAACWPHAFLLSVPEDAGEPVFERIGEALAVEGGEDLLGRPLGEALPNTLIGQALSGYERVLEAQVPITHGGEFTDVSGRSILYRSVITPIDEVDANATRLLCAANCKVKDNAGD